MSSHECIRCDGTGRDRISGTGAFGPIFTGACSYCGGKGWTHEAAPVYTKDPFWYLSPQELEDIERQNRESAEYDAQLQDFYDRHEHHRN